MDPAAPKLQPAFFGGLFIGVLSALPIINIGNCCCCLWVIGGGVLAAYLMQQNYPYPSPSPTARWSGCWRASSAACSAPLLSIPMDMMMGPFSGRSWSGSAAQPGHAAGDAANVIENMSAGGITVFRMVLRLFFGVLRRRPVRHARRPARRRAVQEEGFPPPPPGTVEVLPPVKRPEGLRYARSKVFSPGQTESSCSKSVQLRRATRAGP